MVFWKDRRIYNFYSNDARNSTDGFLEITRPFERMEFAREPENVLPDPTADLEWSKFHGAIQDVFAQNASRFGDRTCVVETASRTTRQRNFTYRQIHEASNVLAHFFLQRGIERGEVIMIYAYRGVDLVIAILAVLKAGATFSVVDPAYDSLSERKETSNVISRLC